MKLNKSILLLLLLIILTVYPAAAIVDNLTGTQSVMNFNGTTGSTTMLDGNMTISWNTVGAAHINQTAYKFGGSSLRLFGAANPGNVSQLTSNFASRGTGDYTVEFWSNISKHEGTIDMFSAQDSGNNFAFYYNGASSNYYVIQAGNSYAIPQGPTSVNVWHHIALVRQSGTIRIYVDGISIGSTSAPDSIAMSTFYIGSWGTGASYFYNGYIDDFRFSNYAVYTTDFSPPTNQFVYSNLNADFVGNTTYGAAPLTVLFTDLSTGVTPTTWNWSFGDGTYAITKNATHTFSSNGNYTVNLTVNTTLFSSTMSKTNYINVGWTDAPVTSFTANTTEGNKPVVVMFNDTSTNNPTSWLWKFGDGNTSTQQHPVFTYNIAGTYTVNLTAINPAGNSTLSRTSYITVHPAGFPIVDFVGSPTSGAPGSLVHFTDTSTITNTTGLVYNWSFGDGTYSSTVGNVQHVYNYASIYDVNLTITNAIGTAYELKQQYIVISTDSDYLMKYPPTLVNFHIQEFFGDPIPNATVYATGITTSTGNWDWVAQLLGYPLNEIPFNVEEMNITTDSEGNAGFLMINSVKYNITVVKAGYTFPSTIIAPSEKSYTIVANYNGTPWISGGNNTQADVNITVSSTAVNSTYGRIRITYDDTLLSTTGGTISIYQGNLNRSTWVATMPITSNTFWNFTDVPRGSGASYIVQVSATNTISSDPYVRTFTAAMKPQPVTIPGFSSTMLLWLALFFIIFTAAFAGAVHAPQMAIVICIESWIFWAIGWLEPLSLEFSTGELGVIGMLSLATVMAVIWNFREGKRKEKGT